MTILVNKYEEMKFFLSSEIRKLDEFTIQRELITSIELMERAAAMLAQWVTDRFTTQYRMVIFCGAGNNGGDGLAVARILAERDYNVLVYLISPPFTLSPDAMAGYQRLTSLRTVEIHQITKLMPALLPTDIIVDALFGSGLNRPLEGLAADLVRHINSSGATVISVDLPSGLGGESLPDADTACTIRASYTLTFEFPKLSFMFPENNRFVGEMHIIPISLHAEGVSSISSCYHYTTPEDVNGMLPRRKMFSLKIISIFKW